MVKANAYHNFSSSVRWLLLLICLLPQAAWADANVFRPREACPHFNLANYFPGATVVVSNFNLSLFSAFRSNFATNAVQSPACDNAGATLTDDTTPTNTHQISHGFTTSIGATTPYTAVILFKPIAMAARGIQYFISSSSNNAYMVLDQTCKSYSVGSATWTSPTAYAQKLPGGWCMGVLNFTTVSSLTSITGAITLWAHGTSSYTGDGGSGVQVWGFAVLTP